MNTNFNALILVVFVKYQLGRGWDGSFAWPLTGLDLRPSSPSLRSRDRRVGIRREQAVISTYRRGYDLFVSGCHLATLTGRMELSLWTRHRRRRRRRNDSGLGSVFPLLAQSTASN